MAHKIYKILILIILSFLVNGQQFMPGPRVGHTATLLGNKIYYVGGYIGNDITTADFFYLDEKSTWVDLKSQGVKFSQIDGHTSNIGGANQDSIFIIGDSIYRFDTKTNAITAPLILGKVPPRRIDMSAVSYGA